jgi:hypothetical protein
MTRRSLAALALLVFAGLLSSCTDQAGMTGLRPNAAPVHAIADEATGGHPEFFWLPPTVPVAPATTGPFDAGALSELTVEVCELDAANACIAGGPLERFTESGNPVPQRITVDPEHEFYTVDWLTGRSHVDPDRLYRVRVLRDGIELGFIDVQFVDKVPSLGGVDPTRYVGVKRGQQLTLRFRIDEPSARTRVRVNEIESSGGVPGDWVELYNTSAIPLSLAGYVVRDNDDGHTYTLPASATIPAGGYYVIDESELGFGLGAADAVRFFAPDGTTLVDSHAWTSHAPSTYGRCPDGTGAFQTTTAVTKGAANDCRVVVVLNEVEASGGVPGDWIEILNPSPAPADIGGFIFKDNDDTHGYVVPAGTVVPAGGYLVLDEAVFGFGLGSADAARLFRPDGSLIDSYSWSAHATTTYGRCPDGVGPFTTTTTVTKGGINDCSTPPAAIVINEVESNGGTPGDWVELYNPGATPSNLSGYVFRDNDDTHAYVIPAGTVVPAGGYYLLEEAAFAFGLGSADAARLLSPGGQLVDSYTWTAHAPITYGRCPNATGSFASTTASTKGAANACVAQPVFAPWPGDAEVQTVSAAGAFGSNLSGLTYEATSSGAPGILWAVQNGPGTLYRLVWNGSIYTPDPASGWAAGKALRYPDGTGNVDAEGVTFALGGPAGGMYVGAERNNDISAVSRNSILRYDVASGTTALAATHEWNLTTDLPVVGANLGIEAVTWIADVDLAAKGFFDEAKGHPYDPAEYPNHQGGLFFVGVEANGTLYAYALDHVGGGFVRVATISSGFPGVMALEFDRDRNELWAVCDNGCFGRSSLLRVDASGRFAVVQQFERPAGMPNLNNEGFAFAPLAECASGKRAAFWSDDSETDGFSIRRGTLTCSPF